MNKPTSSLDSSPIGDIVIVDDTVANLKLFTEILTNEGYLVRPASDGALALRSIYIKPPALILLDIRMPDMDGFEVCAHLKADQRTCNIPIIFLSSLIDMEDRIHGFKLGAADYITKPFQAQDVLMRVKVHANLFLAQTQLKQQNLEFERLNQQLTSEIAARQQAEMLLKAHQENLEALINQRTCELGKANEKYQELFLEARDGIVVVDVTSGRVVDCNPEFERQCERSLAQLKILKIWTLLPAQQFEAGKTLFQQIVASGSGSSDEFTIQQLDGSLLPVEFVAKGIQFDNKPYLQFMVRDITERKQTQEALIISEKEFRLLAESMPQIVWITNLAGLNIYFNHQWVEYTGLSLEESYGDGWIKPFHPDDQKRAWDAWQDTVSNNAIYSLECQLRRADGIYHWWLIRGTPLFDEYGEICKWFGTCTDIHEIKEAEKALQDSERQLQFTLQTSHTGGWDLDLVDYTGHRTLEHDRIFGYESLLPEWNYQMFLEHVLPEDRDEVDRLFQHAIATKTNWDFECRIRRTDGEVRWIWASGKYSLDDDIMPHMAGIVQDITERKKAEETIYELGYYDPLTHLPNRRLMLDRLKQALISRKLQNRYGAILFIDLNNFKTLNDTKGHDIGDLLLIEVTKRLQAVVHEDDTVARIGGDEFVVLLDTLDMATDLAAAQAESVAKRVLNAINQPFNLQGYEYRCSASIGIALFHSHEISVDNLVKQADMATDQAKQVGRNAICFFDPAIQTALEFRVQLESWMRKALQDEYRLYFQIQVDDESNAIGAEALIRWHHPEQGIISPADFIPLAEETGLIIPIGQWVLETACIQLKAWEQNQNMQHLILAVNVSTKQFNQPDFVRDVLAVLDQTGANPDKLKLELTESMLAHNVKDIIAKMNALKVHGVKFSLDDFGTGFSSLSYLKYIPFNQLKIDQSFVRDALTDSNNAAIIRTIIDLGQSLGMDVIAEGVETEQQQNFLTAHGCKHYQGYLFSKPLPLEAFEQLLGNKM